MKNFWSHQVFFQASSKSKADSFIGTPDYEAIMNGGIVKFLIEAEDQTKLYYKLQSSMKTIRKADPGGQFIGFPVKLEEGTL